MLQHVAEYPATRGKQRVEDVVAHVFDVVDQYARAVGPSDFGAVRIDFDTDVYSTED